MRRSTRATTRLGLIAAAPLLAAGLLAGPAEAAAPPDSPGVNAKGQAQAQANCEKIFSEQKTNDKSHQGTAAGSGENYPTNCDHFYQQSTA